MTFGYVHGRRASDIWLLVQSSVEASLITGDTLIGFNADLVRCFNTLPRFPLFKLMRHLGLSSSVITGWSTALEQLQRRFKLGNHTGHSISSVTGYPEGDPLSILAMLTFNLVLARYMSVYAPTVLCPAYVDNLQMIAANFGAFAHGLTVFRTFMSAWDIALDSNKSYSWANSTSLRNLLRSLGLPVLLHAKDLGAQMCFSALNRTQVQLQRLDSVRHLWQVLRTSSASSWHKLLAIRVAILPKVLHGCENRPMSSTTLTTLRSRAMYALRWNRAGASPLIRWSWMQNPLVDPEFFQIWQALATWWRMFHAFPALKAYTGLLSFFPQPRQDKVLCMHCFKHWNLLDGFWTVSFVCICMGCILIFAFFHCMSFVFLRKKIGINLFVLVFIIGKIVAWFNQLM